MEQEHLDECIANVLIIKIINNNKNREKSILSSFFAFLEAVLFKLFFFGKLNFVYKQKINGKCYKNY